MNGTSLDDCVWSNDGEHIIVGSYGRSVGTLMLWTSETNLLVDTLSGPLMGMRCLACNPTTGALAVGMADGGVDLWGMPSTWTAFAPGFQALPANIEYVEKEDEVSETFYRGLFFSAAQPARSSTAPLTPPTSQFDIKPIEKQVGSGAGEEADVDVVTVVRPAVYDEESGEEGEEDAFQLKHLGYGRESDGLDGFVLEGKGGTCKQKIADS